MARAPLLCLLLAVSLLAGQGLHRPVNHRGLSRSHEPTLLPNRPGNCTSVLKARRQADIDALMHALLFGPASGAPRARALH